MKTDKLKPCPFCGGKATMHITFTPGETFLYQIVCKNNCWQGATDFYLTQEKAVKAWSKMVKDENVSK